MKHPFSLVYPLFIGLAAGLPFVGVAQVRDSLQTTRPAVDTTAKTAQAPVTSSSGLTVSGYIEAYYVQDFNQQRTQERPAFLYNYKRNREVNINLAFVKAAYAGERVRGNLAVQVGTYPQYNYAAEQQVIRNIFEANAGVKLSAKRDLWLDGGIFASHIGFESAIGKDCWTLTRSILAENSPYYLAGAKLTYNSPDGKWTLLGMVTNGWQRIARVPGYTRAAVTTQVQYRPSPALTLNWSSFLGSDRPSDLKQTRFFNNFYAIINPTGRFGAILGFDVGHDARPAFANADGSVNPSGTWYSPVVIARLKTSPKTYVAGRVEYYYDPNGVIITTGTSNGFQTWGYSVNYDYAVVSNALLRLEYRLFDSKDAVFVENNVPASARRTNSSLTAAIAVSF